MKHKYKRGCHPNSRNSPFQKGHKINVGRVCSEETRKKIGDKNKTTPKRFGWQHSKQTKEKISIAHTGEKNHSWNDINPSYSSVHKWISRHFNYKKVKCEHCGSKRFLEWAIKKGEKPSHSIEKYLVLCSSCHKKYDYTAERKKRLSNSLKGRKIT